MQRRAEEAPAPLTRTIAQIDAEQAVLTAERERAEKVQRDEERRKRLAEGARVLVGASPSPKKKSRATSESDRFNAGPPSQPFAEKMRAEKAKSYDQEESLRFEESVASTSKSAAQIAALPRRKSNYLAGLNSVKETQTESTSRRASNRTTGFHHSAIDLRSSDKGKERQSITPSVKPKKSTKKIPSPSIVGLASKPSSMARHTAPSPIKSIKAPVAHKLFEEEEEEEEDEDGLDILDAPKKEKTRHRDGTIIERIPIGPVEHALIPGDLNYDRIEPNSGIALKSRIITHDALQLHLTSRYHISPAKLYSIVRLGKGAGDLEVPVVGDFIVIGVLAQKDEARFVRADALNTEVKEVAKVKKWGNVLGIDGKRRSGGRGEDEEDGEGGEELDTKKEPDEMFARQTKKQKQRRYIKFTVVDLSTTSAAASGTGAVTLMLFESDSSDMVEDEEGKKRATYRGGSGGAYEKWWKESVGAVVAILNPRVMKQKIVPGMPGSNTITLTPDSAESMILIGRARDLSSCRALVQGGKPCGQWCDARVNSICNYHLSTRVKSTAANRPETNSSNASHAATITFDQKAFNSSFKPGYRQKSSQAPCDRVNKIGLLPRDNTRLIDGNMTYVTTGSATLPSRSARAPTAAGLRAAAIQSGNGSGGYVAGWRDGPTVLEAKKSRLDQKKAKEDRDWEMKQLLHKTKDDTSLGGQYLKMGANRKAAKAKEEEEKLAFLEGANVGGAKGKKKRSRRDSEENEELDAEEDEEGKKEKKRTKPFSTTALRLIGYDPTSNGDTGREEDADSKKKRLDAISFLSANVDRSTPNLRAPPGVKIRSGVVAPITKKLFEDEEVEEDLPDLYRAEKEVDSDEDLVIEGRPS